MIPIFGWLLKMILLLCIRTKILWLNRIFFRRGLTILPGLLYGQLPFPGVSSFSVLWISVYKSICFPKENIKNFHPVPRMSFGALMEAFRWLGAGLYIALASWSAVAVSLRCAN